jgi:hypothetical protein
MKKTIFILTLFSLIVANGYAQTIDHLSANLLRKMVMQSDVIFASSDYEIGFESANDYSLTQFYIVYRMDSLITNKTKFKIGDKIRSLQRIEDYPTEWNDTLLFPPKPAQIHYGINPGFRYTDLFFLKKEGKQYKLLGWITDIEWSSIETHYIPLIREIEKINQITDLNNRYAQTMDWYIAQNEYPDDDFFAFYRQQKLIGDTPVLSDEQLQKAKDDFLNGSENLLPFIKDKFPLEIKKYYLDKLREIRQTVNIGRSEYYQFELIIESMYDLEYGGIEYMMSNLLWESGLSGEDKETIMDYFIRKVEEDIDLQK